MVYQIFDRADNAVMRVRCMSLKIGYDNVVRVWRKTPGDEPGVNDKAMQRAIVIHGASYVSESFIKQYGRLGRSWGCPALPEDIAQQIIDEIKGGSCLFVYSDDQNYLKKSKN